MLVEIRVTVLVPTDALARESLDFGLSLDIDQAHVEPERFARLIEPLRLRLAREFGPNPRSLVCRFDSEAL